MAEFKKIQTYMAATEEEYDKAIEFIRSKEEVEQLIEVGTFDANDMFGDPVKAYVFMFVSPNSVMEECMKVMNVSGIYLS